MVPIAPQIGSKALTCPKLNLIKPFAFVNYQMCLSRILFEFRPLTPWPTNHLHLTHQFTLTLPYFNITNFSYAGKWELVKSILGTTFGRNHVCLHLKAWNRLWQPVVSHLFQFWYVFKIIMKCSSSLCYNIIFAKTDAGD